MLTKNEVRNAKRRAARAAAKAAKLVTPVAPVYVNPFRSGTKRSLGFDMLARAEGVTVVQAARAMGWSVVVARSQLFDSAAAAKYGVSSAVVDGEKVYRLGQAL